MPSKPSSSFADGAIRKKKPSLVFENFESLWEKPRLERLPLNSVEFCLEIKLVTQTTGKQSRGGEDSVNSVDCC